MDGFHDSFRRATESIDALARHHQALMESPAVRQFREMAEANQRLVELVSGPSAQLQKLMEQARSALAEQALLKPVVGMQEFEKLAQSFQATAFRDPLHEFHDPVRAPSLPDFDYSIPFRSPQDDRIETLEAEVDELRTRVLVLEAELAMRQRREGPDPEDLN